MPRGISLSLETRILISDRFQAGFSPEDIFFFTIFGGRTNVITLGHLKNLQILFADDNFSENYLCGPSLKLVRPRLIGAQELNSLMDFVKIDGVKTLHTMKQNFIHNYHDEEDNMPYSQTTFKRAIKRGNLSYKCIQRRHLLCDDNLGLEFLERIAHIDVFNLIDIDETASNSESCYQSKGWAPVGNECLRTQIVIGTRTFSTIAAVTPLGYICWEIFEGEIFNELFLFNILLLFMQGLQLHMNISPIFCRREFDLRKDLKCMVF